MIEEGIAGKRKKNVITVLNNLFSSKNVHAFFVISNFFFYIIRYFLNYIYLFSLMVLGVIMLLRVVVYCATGYNNENANVILCLGLFSIILGILYLGNTYSLKNEEKDT